MIKPTIGRVLWYWPRIHETDKQPRAAIVTWVHRDDLVNLAVFDPNGKASGRTGVELYQGKGDRPDREHCEWMPYQIGQAAKDLHPVDQAKVGP